MTKVLAGMTSSLDGYCTGPGDRPGAGLGEGGERLHDWVFGGPWTYDGERGAPADVDRAYLDRIDLELERTGMVESPFATRLRFRVARR